MNMLTNDHILYHGAVIKVSQPLTHVGRSDLDFGPGFYVTNDREQAVKWAFTKAGRRPGSDAVLNIYKFEVDRFKTDDRYRIKVFPEYNVEWLDFISRSRKNCKPWEGYDWIEGGIADDRVISTVDAYIDGYMSASQAMDKLVNEQLRHQVCILNQEIIDNYLVFDHSETL